MNKSTKNQLFKKALKPSKAIYRKLNFDYRDASPALGRKILSSRPNDYKLLTRQNLQI